MRDSFNGLAKAGLVSLLFGVSSCGKSSPVETFYDSFPDAAHLKDAREVKKYGLPGAKHCLVHIRQIHSFTPELSLNEAKDKLNDLLRAVNEVKNLPGYSPEKFPEMANAEKTISSTREMIDSDYKRIRTLASGVSEVQGKIYDIILDLHNKRGVSSVRVEGVTEEFSKSRCLGELLLDDGHLLEMGYVTKEELIDEKYLLFGGAPLLLGSREIVSVNPAESESLNDSAMLRLGELHQKGVPLHGSDDTLIYRDREDYVLRLVYEAEEDYSVVIFGGDHDFKDNIERWNKEHPKDKFSLIVVTPERYNELSIRQ